MKYLLALAIAVFLVSCGNQKIRLRRVQTTKQTVVKVDKETRASIKTQQKSDSKKEEVIAEVNSVEAVPATEDEVENTTQEVVSEKPEIITSVEEKKPSAEDEKVTQALEAEKNASRALSLLILGLPMSLLILPGLIFIIFGGVNYRRAKKSPYISEKGKNQLGIAFAFLFVDIVILSLLVFGITMLILS